MYSGYDFWEKRMIYNLFGLDGRVSRLSWWMTQLMAMSLTCSLFLAAPAPAPSIADPKTAEDLATVAAEMTWAFLQDPVLLGLMVFNFLLFITTSIRRLHDRGRPGWRIIFTLVPIILLAFSIYLFIVQQAPAAGFMAAMLALAGIFLSALWLIIECGMLPGDDADNDYGPPPTGKWARRSAFAEELAAMSLARDVTASRMEGGYGTYATSNPAMASSPGHSGPVFGKL
jgi:uncharacterized membrane protein YhaH (DUF805 family)